MVGNREAVSFDAIIQAGRAQREKQKLADEIFGQGRRSITAKDGSRKSGTGLSLASRVGNGGVNKASQRSNSKTPKANIESQWGHDLHGTKNTKGPRIARPPRENPMAQSIKKDLLYNAAVTQSSHSDIPTTVIPGSYGAEISIRGTAGPYVVIGSNFAPGTTAADIESAMIPSGGEMQSCRILSASPTVIAEMVFAEKQNAENVIATFNNKKADGRILHVYMKSGGPSPVTVLNAIRKATAPRVDLTRTSPPSYNDQQVQTDRRKRAEPEFQDGSYGFNAKDDTMDVDIATPAPAPALVPTPIPAPVLVAPAPANVSAPRSDRRDDRRDDRRGYDAPKDYGRGRSYYDRDRDSGRPRNDQRLYSDEMYSRPRGRGYR